MVGIARYRGRVYRPGRLSRARSGIASAVRRCDSVAHENQDAIAIAHSDRSFDLVIFKSVIGALQTKERQMQAICEMHRVLTPGGVLLMAENLVGSRLHAILRSRFVPWEHRSRYIDLEDDGDLFALFDEVELETWGFFGLLGRTEAQRELLGRIDSLV